MGEFFNVILIYPIINIIVVIYKAFLTLGAPFALGFSIIALTILIKIITHPLTAAQLKSAAKMQNLKPHLDKLKDQHKGDKTRLSQETMRLYKEHGVNPAAGCLPLLIQLPIFIALYNVLIQVVGTNSIETVDKINKSLYFEGLRLDKPWDPNFFGISLAAKPADWGSAGAVLLLIPIITTGLQFIQSKMMMPKTEISKVTAGKEDDFQKIMQTQMVYFMPLMIGFFSYTFPVGLSLYWNIFTLFGIIQQHRIQKAIHGKKTRVDY